jgi:serine/threonine protein kinase
MTAPFLKVTEETLNATLQVFKATWRGTVVAVKIMVLPSHMSGKEKREKMAVMETAISSSLSHPNCVATYTYAVEPVRSNTTLKDHSEAEEPGAGLSMHDSSQSWRAGGAEGTLAGLRKGSSGSNADAGAFSWEVRLVQEYCDLGSLRSAFKQNRFK